VKNPDRPDADPDRTQFGRPPLPADEHIRRGTYRADRHAEASDDDVSARDRAMVLVKLPRDAKELAAALLDRYAGWNPAMLITLRMYVLSCTRVAALQDAKTVNIRRLHAELTINLELLRVLGFELPEDAA
jgi:hypothetical protein